MKRSLYHQEARKDEDVTSRAQKKNTFMKFFLISHCTSLVEFIENFV